MTTNDRDRVLKFRPRPSVPPAGFARCARCEVFIPEDLERCPKCGIHFSGRAADFDPSRRHISFFSRGLVRWTLALLALLAMLTLVVRNN